MDEHQQHENGGHGSARVYETPVQSDARGGDGKEPRRDRGPGRVGTFDAKADVAGGRYVYGWQQQIVGFYGMRLRKNVEFGRRFAEAEGIAGLVGLQREYVSDMLHDYAANFWSFYGLAGFGLRGRRHTAERLDR